MKSTLKRAAMFFLVLSLSALGCIQTSRLLPTPDNIGTVQVQPATEAVTAEATSELVATDTPQAQVDLSAWGASYFVKYSPDGSLLAVANSWDIHVYDPTTLEEIFFIPGEVEGGRGLRIEDFAFSSDNKVLSVAYYDNSANAFGVRQIDISTGAELSNWMLLDLGDDYSDVPDVLVVSPNGSTFALTDRSTQSEHGPIFVRVWDVASGQELASFSEGYAESLVFSPDGRILVVGDLLAYWNGETLWDASSGKKIRNFDVTSSQGVMHNPRAVFFIDKDILAVAVTYGAVLDDSFTVMLLDLETGEELLSFDVPVAPSMAGNPVFAMAVSNDGSMLATGSALGIKIWDAASGNELQSIDMAVDNNGYYHYTLTFSPDDTAIILGSSNLYQVIMWDVATGEQLAP